MKRLPAVRERTEELERASLSTWATLAVETKGRDTHEEPDPFRTAFQADRDRILGSRAFGALKHKSHLLLGRKHRCVRSSYSLSVAEIARTIGRGLRLNEDLIEAIAFGQDLGAPPFAGAGEEALSSVTGRPFRHEEQGVRVVESLAADGRGLNLTFEVRDGILNHRADAGPPATVEGQTVQLAGRVAAVTHDFDELVAAGVVSEDDVPAGARAALGDTSEQRRATMVHDVVTESVDRPQLAMSPRAEHALGELERVVADRCATSPAMVAEHNRAVHCLASIAVFSLQHPAHLASTGDPVAGTCDMVSGLTDAGALDEFSTLFLPSV